MKASSTIYWEASQYKKMFKDEKILNFNDMVKWYVLSSIHTFILTFIFVVVVFFFCFIPVLGFTLFNLGVGMVTSGILCLPIHFSFIIYDVLKYKKGF